MTASERATAPVTARERAVEAFRRRFGAEPARWVRAPGRVNLIGDHTDYNDGFVLPLAIDRDTCIALRPRDDGRVLAVSEEAAGVAGFDLAELDAPLPGWGVYLQGMAWALREAGLEPRGFDGAIASDVPVGAGLSSSAALELAAALALLVGREQPARHDLARLAQRAENDWVGVACGIMDQLVIACGEADHALLIDCRSLATEPVPLPDDAAVLVLDTDTRRGLAASAYNERRAECETAARVLGVPALRDADAALLEMKAAALGTTLVRRVAHVLGENSRTRAAAAALAAGELARTGALMVESHESLRTDFAVSSAALDAMVAAALAQPGCYGARMTGAGFGGCAVALVAAERALGVGQAATAVYGQETGRDPRVYVCRAAEGAADGSLG